MSKKRRDTDFLTDVIEAAELPKIGKQLREILVKETE
jgi:hypothetical protein